MTKSKNELIRQIVLFFGLEISLIVCNLIYNKVSGSMEDYVKIVT